MKLKVITCVLVFMLCLSACKGNAAEKENKQEIDRTIQESKENKAIDRTISSNTGITSADKDSKSPTYTFMLSDEELREAVERSGNDKNGDGRLTAADFDLTDDAGMDIESPTVGQKDFTYNPEDTESDAYMKDYISITGIEDSGRYLSMHKLEVLGDGIIETDNGRARIIGDPYMIGLSDSEEFNTEYYEFKDTPLNIELFYDDTLLKEAGVTENEGISAYLRKPGENYFEKVDGTLNHEKYSFTAVYPGQYVLAAPVGGSDEPDTTSENTLTEE